MARRILTTGKTKNALWSLYESADPLVRMEIFLELKKNSLERHWRSVASYSHYDLRHAPWPLRDVFVRLIPESKALFEQHHETKATQ
ncbi:hypothetical protein [Arsenicibacter rosenii]|uniref:hypothetical protein n=1 Tax=Arsenicibacter rosenii TaxID=1750698 RepID=UPI0011609862|nr:hypothetical protein [Arsenicibacter rosenii]